MNLESILSLVPDRSIISQLIPEYRKFLDEGNFENARNIAREIRDRKIMNINNLAIGQGLMIEVYEKWLKHLITNYKDNYIFPGNPKPLGNKILEYREDCDVKVNENLVKLYENLFDKVREKFNVPERYTSTTKVKDVILALESLEGSKIQATFLSKLIKFIKAVFIN